MKSKQKHDNSISVMRDKEQGRELKNAQELDMVRWLKRVERLILAHSTEPRQSGKYRGHRSSDPVAWVGDLAREVRTDIKRMNKGIGYDENMAQAALMGKILVAWYANLHRAKSYDIHRPLETRKEIGVKVAKYRAEVSRLMADDELLGATWGDQIFDFPFGKYATGGDYK